MVYSKPNMGGQLITLNNVQREPLNRGKKEEKINGTRLYFEFQNKIKCLYVRRMRIVCIICARAIYVNHQTKRVVIAFFQIPTNKKHAWSPVQR